MKKPFFEPIDFKMDGMQTVSFVTASQIANEKLEKEIQSWVTVVQMEPKSNFGWYEERPHNYHKYTRAAKLAFIENLPKKECDHEPKVSVSIKGFDLSKATHLHQIPEQFYCLKCGVELVPTSWSAK